MTTKITHTPLPWHIAPWGQNIILLDAEGRVITSPSEHEDADYIVQACNAFPDLVAALKAVLAEYTMTQGAQIIIESALTKAGAA